MSCGLCRESVLGSHAVLMVAPFAGTAHALFHAYEVDTITKGLTMWLLVILLLSAPVGVSHMTVLNTFATYEECKPERDRIGFEMAESYPYESDFRIVCELQEQKPPLLPIRYEREVQNPFSSTSSYHVIATAPLPRTHLDN